jgi:hypothetical protein
METLDTLVDEFKIELFGTKEIILHTADISRNKNGFEKLKNNKFRKVFLDKLNALMERLEYKVIACAIQKEEHLEQYGQSAIDPYLLSLNVLVERFCMEVGIEDQGIIIAEKRDRHLDHELELSWLAIKINGTKFFSGSKIEKRVKTFSLKDKKDNINGLQLADLIVSPIGRYVLGKKIKKDFEIIESKFRKGKHDNYDGYGLVVLPK